MEVKAKFDHFNVNVTDLNRSIEFYSKALGFTEALSLIHISEPTDTR